MNKIGNHEVWQAHPTAAIKDNGRVRIGTVSPAFPPVRPAPANVADPKRVRMGTVSPAFPPVRAR